jgi:UDP-N-acetyl-D-glucosamine dehydrogenase
MRTFRFVELANEVNEHMPDYAQSGITSLLNEQRKSLDGSKVLLLWLAYKKGTSDWRESPSVAVADQLAESGARIEFCDPRPRSERPQRTPSLVAFNPENLAAADVVVVLNSCSTRRTS